MIAYGVSERGAAEHEVLGHDLTILEAMAAHMSDYLMSEATHWELGQHRPPLTLGGYLMRRRRLGLLADHLTVEERNRLAAANQRFEVALIGRAVRFESRAQAEIGDRLREWTVFLRDLGASTRLARDEHYYVQQADTRVVIEELVETLRQPPYRLPQHVPGDVVALDRRLQSRWQPGPFIWAAVWQVAYPVGRYWWLYGHIKG